MHLGMSTCEEARTPVEHAHRWMTQRYSHPLDVMVDRLIASTLLHVNENHYFWYSHAHHLVLDGHGAMTLMNRVASWYTHMLEDTKPAPLQALGLQALYELDMSYRSFRPIRNRPAILGCAHY